MNAVEALNEYEMRHLCAHLADVGRLADLQLLLALETESGGNAWYEAQRKRGGVADYAVDLETAWRCCTDRANTELAANDVAPALGSEFRFGLLQSTLGSLAEGAPPALLLRAVETGVLTVAEAYTYAGHKAGGWGRAEALARLAPLLPETLLRSALEAAGALPDRMHRDKALAGLLPYRAELGEVQEAFAAALDIQDGRQCADTLRGIARHANDEQLAYIRSQIENVRDSDRKNALLAVLNTGAPVRKQDLESVQQIADADERARVVATIAPELNESEIERALALLLQMQPGRAQEQALVSLARHVSRPRQIGAEIRRRFSRLYAAQAAFAARLPALEREQELDRLLAEIRTDAYPYTRTLHLTQVCPLLPESMRAGVLREALKAATEAPSKATQQELISALAPLLTPELTSEALSISFQIGDQIRCTTLMSVIWNHVPAPLKEHMRSWALKCLRTLGGDPTAIVALTRIAVALPDEDRIIAQRRALAATRDIVDATWRAKVVKNIVPTMGEDLLVDAVEAIDGLGDPADQAEAYCSLVRCATGGRRGEVLEMAWRAAQMSRNAWQRATAFGCIALVTPREMKQRAVKASWEAARASKNISHMADVVSRYPIEFRAGPLRTALNAIDALSDPRERSVPLMILTASIAELLGWTEVLRRLDEIDPGPHRAIALGSALIFAARLPGEAQPIALRNAIDTLRWLDDRARAAGLESLAPWMDSALLARAFDAALEIDDDDARARATAVLLQRAMAESTADVVDLWRVALRRAARRQRSQAFEDMTVLEPILERKGGREAITEAACAILAVMRWFP